MINVLIPMAAKSQHFSETEYPFPSSLIEIGKKTIIEHVLNNLESAGKDVQFIFVISNADCRKFHLDSTLNIITNNKCKIIKLENETKGAACSALMAISYIENSQPLIIANSDQIFDEPLHELISQLGDADAGIVTFESVHPRWSYVRLNEDGLVIETAEKRPISRNAIAGLYYFRVGSDFIESTKRMVLKDSHVNGNFFIAPALNEMILEGKKIRSIPIDSNKYHTLYTPQKIKEYEAHLERKGVL